MESEVKSGRFGLGSGCSVNGDNLNLEIPRVAFSLEYQWTPVLLFKWPNWGFGCGGHGADTRAPVSRIKA